MHSLLMTMTLTMAIVLWARAMPSGSCAFKKTELRHLNFALQREIAFVYPKGFICASVAVLSPIHWHPLFFSVLVVSIRVIRSRSKCF